MDWDRPKAVLNFSKPKLVFSCGEDRGFFLHGAKRSLLILYSLTFDRNASVLDLLGRFQDAG